MKESVNMLFYNCVSSQIIKNKKILLEVALTLNKEMFNENKISYKMYKYTESNILKELKSLNN